MQIKNETSWRTDHLRTLINKIAEDEIDTEMRKRYVVTVKYRRRNSTIAGRAGIGQAWMQLLLQRDVQVQDRADLARIIAHEFAHSRGWRHPQMETSRYMRMGDWQERYAWANDLPLDQQQIKAKPSGEAKMNLAMIHAAKQAEKWKTKMKRAQTILKKWQRKERYYMTLEPPGHLIGLRLKGERHTYYLPIDWAYKEAVLAHVRAERRRKLDAKKGMTNVDL